MSLTYVMVLEARRKCTYVQKNLLSKNDGVRGALSHSWFTYRQLHQQAVQLLQEKTTIRLKKLRNV